ncbi:Coenzyme F420 hydrogenase/dehydrogenase, beta subunit C-terminal domain [Desulfurococcaceae archaeon MEX13E-LK6-19]|nr:Coenzyme F420 hydrogenase/dehydrogenase, beta subunit C-terminal domain [Desulfurococcaceae archaeon MEX13E-LK6-19]
MSKGIEIGKHYYMRATDKKLLESSCCGGVVSAVLKYLLEKHIVDTVISIKRDRILGGEPVFISDPYRVYDVAGAFTIAPINMAKLLRDYIKPGERVALTLKPCEAKAVEYLVSRGLFKRDDMVLIGLNCGGLFDPFSLRESLLGMNIDPKELVSIKYMEDHIEFILTGNRKIKVNYVEGARILGYREACRRCGSPVPENVDIICGYWGLLPGYEKYTYTIPSTSRGAEILDSMAREGLLEVIEAPRKGVELRNKLIEVIKKSAMVTREEEFKELDRIGLENILSKCLLCLECWHACPIRSEKEVLVWKKSVGPVLWQVSIITYMYDKCVECGSCEDVCPMKIPFSLIIQRIKSLREELGV